MQPCIARSRNICSNWELGCWEGQHCELKTSRKGFLPVACNRWRVDAISPAQWMLLPAPACWREPVQEGLGSEANFHSRLSQEQHARTLTSS